MLHCVSHRVVVLLLSSCVLFAFAQSATQQPPLCSTVVPAGASCPVGPSKRSAASQQQFTRVTSVDYQYWFPVIDNIFEDDGFQNTPYTIFGSQGAMNVDVTDTTVTFQFTGSSQWTPGTWNGPVFFGYTAPAPTIASSNLGGLSNANIVINPDGTDPNSWGINWQSLFFTGGVTQVVINVNPGGVATVTNDPELHGFQGQKIEFNGVTGGADYNLFTDPELAINMKLAPTDATHYARKTLHAENHHEQARAVQAEEHSDVAALGIRLAAVQNASIVISAGVTIESAPSVQVLIGNQTYSIQGSHWTVPHLPPCAPNVVIDRPHHSEDVIVRYAGYVLQARQRHGHLREGRPHFDLRMSVPASAAELATQGKVSGVLGQTLLGSAVISTRPADFAVSELLATDAPNSSFGSSGFNQAPFDCTAPEAAVHHAEVKHVGQGVHKADHLANQQARTVAHAHKR